MSTTSMHLSINVRGAIRNCDYDWFRHEDGTPCSKEEALDYLLAKLADGWERIPVGDCEGFDPKTGCPGHSHE